VRFILIFNVKRRKAHGMNTAVMWNFRYWEFSCVMGYGVYIRQLSSSGWMTIIDPGYDNFSVCQIV
jgi:hypothetical protein